MTERLSSATLNHAGRVALMTTLQVIAAGGPLETAADALEAAIRTLTAAEARKQRHADQP